MNPQLKFNCPKKWEDMKIGLLSRQCDHCSKDVFDFTKLSRQEIVEYLMENRGKDVCGRIYPSQLDYSHTEQAVIISEIVKKHRSNTNLMFYLLAVGSLTLVACGSSDTQDVKTGIEVCADSSSQTCNGKKQDIELPPNSYLGGIGLEDDTVYNPNVPMHYPQVMPEFIGGQDSLIAFLKANIQYPEKEKEAGVQGKLYATFVIDVNGSVTDAQILTSTVKSENFRAEVLRVIKLMPRWKPGKNRGLAVATAFTLPVTFKLK